jgi:drug/metabolite transporter (DMT)-like permease
MFVGELFCLGAYYAKVFYLKRQEKIDVEKPAIPQGDFIMIDGVQYKTKINPLLLAIPACFDIVASTMMNIALTLIAASVYQMMRGMIIIFTSLMSIMFLKRRLFRQHWSSLATIFLGVFMVGLSSFLSDNSGGGKSSQSQAIGFIMIILAQVFASCLLIVEEKLLGQYYLDPLKVVGFEGLWGVLMWCVLLPIF